jgi:hypothetical protein
MNNTGIFDLTQILISKKFEEKIVFDSSVLAWIRIRNWIRNWIRIRIESIRIQNPWFNYSLILYSSNIR